jgi:hypothetical protein
MFTTTGFLAYHSSQIETKYSHWRWGKWIETRRGISSLMLLVAVMTANLPALAGNSTAPFKWKDFLGTEPEKIASRLQGVAECSNDSTYVYDIGSLPSRTSLEEFGGWDSPTNQEISFRGESKSFRSMDITITTCSINSDTNLIALSFKSKIFLLKLRYRTCEKEGLRCSINVSEIDGKMYDQFKDKLVVVPGRGNPEASGHEIGEYLRLESMLASTAIAKQMVSEASRCYFQNLQNKKYRCLLSVRVTNEFLQAISFAEVDEGSFLKQDKRLLVTEQRFANVGAYRHAVEAFLKEANAEVDKILESNDELESKELRGSKIIESVE